MNLPLNVYQNRHNIKMFENAVWASENQKTPLLPFTSVGIGLSLYFFEEQLIYKSPDLLTT